MAPNVTETIYKTWDDGFRVRKMTKTDTHLLEKWFSGICPTSIDLEVALESYPYNSGFFVGELNGEIVASAVIVPVADGLCYGSYFYVRDDCRSLGLGRRIRQLAQDHAGENIVAIDSATELVEMFHRQGAMEDFAVSRFMGNIPAIWDMQLLGEIIEISSEKVSALIEYDNLCFIRPGSSERKSLLQNWLSIPGSACVAVVNKSGDLIGYGCRRPAIEGNDHIIGPLYADTYQAAYSIVHALCDGLQGGRIMFDICMYHQEVLQLVATLHLEEDLKMVRMYLNGHPGKLNHRVYGLTSIDVGGF